jgi:iron complex outermembrane receptor protein
MQGVIKMARKRCLFEGALFLLTASGSAAYGADTVDSSETNVGDIGQVVVTARRRTEDLQEVPVAVTALSQAMLVQASVASAYDLNRAVPGLSVYTTSGDSTSPAFSIRGRGLTVGASASSVETYFAEVPLGSPYVMGGLPAQFFDMQSVEVLKGPQGTLFGRSTTGGAVLLVPQAPTDQLEGYARVQGGNYGDFQFEGAINLPLAGDKAVLRIAGFEWHREGYDRTAGGLTSYFGKVLPSQTYDNQDVQEVRATLLLRPLEGLQNSTIVTYHTDQNRQSDNGALLLGPQGVYTPAGYNPRLSASAVDLSRPKSHDWAVINTTTYELMNDLTLKNIFGYIHASGYTEDAENLDGVASPDIDLFLPPRPRRNFQTTDEFQLQGKSFDRRLSWTVGGLVDDTREPSENDSINIAQYGQEFSSLDTRFVQYSVTSRAAYGSGTFALTDKINLTAGFRHSWDLVQQRIVSVQALVVDLPADIIVPTTRASFQGNSYDIGADYHPTQAVMIYGGYRHGYKRGGFSETQNISYTPETVDDFHLGVKTRFSIGGIPTQFNIEGYYDLYHNQQVSEIGFQDGLVTNLTYNAPESTYRGLDADLIVDPTDWLTLRASYSLIDAYYTKWPDVSVPGSTVNLALNPVPFAPKNKIGATLRFHSELPDGRGEIAFLPSITYQDKLYTQVPSAQLPQAENDVFTKGQNFNVVAFGGDVIPAYALVDLRLEWNHLLGSKFNAAFNVTNVTDKVFVTGELATLNYGVQGDTYGPPRMFNFELSTAF